MVLQEATLPSNEEPFSEPPPASDIDQYAGDTNPTYVSARESSYIAVNPPGPNQVFVNLNNLPRPWSLLGGRSQPAVLARTVRETSEEASRVIQRPLRQEEADAIAFHRANAISIASYGTPIGVTAAFIQAWRHAKTFRFPGWTPGEKFNPDAFGPIKGSSARWLWQSARFNAYGALGLIIGQIFFGSYAWMGLAAGQLKDPRLKDMMTEFQRQYGEAERKRENLVRERSNDAPGPKPGETYEMARQRQAASQRRGSVVSREDADMSPTGGAFGQEYQETGADSGLLSDAQLQQQVSREKSEHRRHSPDHTPLPSSSKSDNRHDEHRRAADEDHSPKSAERSAGNAWARLRQQAISGTQSANSRSSVSSRDKDTSSSGDSFSFSQSDEDRELAKSEAQKQFDDRVEREREGKDFDDARYNNQRRW